MKIKSIIKNFLIIIIQKSPKGYHVTLKGKKFKFILNYLNSLYPQLNDKIYNVGTKAYWLLNDIDDFPKCKNPDCHNKLSYKNALITTGYGSGYCSIKCEMNDAKHQEHLRKVFQNQYGVNSYPESDDFKYKFKEAWDKKTLEERMNIKSLREQTTLDRYGATNVFCNECEIRKKIDEDNIRKHGSRIWSNPQKSSSTKKRHNEEDPEYYSKIAEKRNDTVRRLCEKDPMYQQRINEKTMQTNIKNTGYAWPIQCPSIRRKMCRKYLYDNIMFDSSPEIAYYIWLKDHNIDFVFHPNSNIQYFDKDGKLHYYEPDFLIIKTNQLEDIKGKQFFKENVSFKISDEYLACLKSNNVRLILENEYMIYIDYCVKKFGHKKWYLRFKNNKSSS